MKVLVLNCGSSSAKYQFLDMRTEQVLAIGKVERIGMEDAIFEYKGAGEKQKEVKAILDHTSAIRTIMGALTHAETGVIKSVDEIKAVGHRVVHGGEEFAASVLITEEVKRTIRQLYDIAPLHNPPNLTGILAAESAMPGIPQVAVFDTAYHQTMPRTSYLYALPYKMYKKHKVRRYGFHGTSHKYVAEVMIELLGKPAAETKIITCHLGNGSSLAAVKGGESFDTSMGFTPLEGMIMGTRSGDVDPGALSFIMQREEIGMSELNSMLNKHSGLWGISGISSDMREIEEEMEAGDQRAKETFEMLEYRLRKYIGSYVAALNGVDAIVFTGGIGENSNALRAAVLQNLSYLGIKLDAEANQIRGQNNRISTADSAVQVWVIPTNEELVIARDAVAIVKA